MNSFLSRGQPVIIVPKLWIMISATSQKLVEMTLVALLHHGQRACGLVKWGLHDSAYDDGRKAGDRDNVVAAERLSWVLNHLLSLFTQWAIEISIRRYNLFQPHFRIFQVALAPLFFLYIFLPSSLLGISEEKVLEEKQRSEQLMSENTTRYISIAGDQSQGHKGGDAIRDIIQSVVWKNFHARLLESSSIGSLEDKSMRCGCMYAWLKGDGRGSLSTVLKLGTPHNYKYWQNTSLKLKCHI